MRIQGARADRLALQWMYSGATLALPRKMEKYQRDYSFIAFSNFPAPETLTVGTAECSPQFHRQR